MPHFFPSIIVGRIYSSRVGRQHHSGHESPPPLLYLDGDDSPLCSLCSRRGLTWRSCSNRRDVERELKYVSASTSRSTARDKMCWDSPPSRPRRRLEAPADELQRGWRHPHCSASASTSPSNIISCSSPPLSPVDADAVHHITILSGWRCGWTMILWWWTTAVVIAFFTSSSYVSVVMFFPFCLVSRVVGLLLPVSEGDPFPVVIVVVRPPMLWIIPEQNAPLFPDLHSRKDMHRCPGFVVQETADPLLQWCTGKPPLAPIYFSKSMGTC
nr:uncharacterized protein LOC109777980 isoform X1 [Aegilops tauschii subsp. strangulata]